MKTNYEIKKQITYCVKCGERTIGKVCGQCKKDDNTITLHYSKHLDKYVTIPEAK